MAESTTTTAELVKPPSLPKRILEKIKGLSTRDKILGFGLILAAIIAALVFFLILPANERLATAQVNYNDLKNQKSTTETTIASKPTSQQQYDQAKVKYDEYIAKYQAPMLPEDLDRLITTFLTDCGFETTSLTLTPVTTENTSPFVPGSTRWVSPTETSTSTAAGGAATAPGGTVSGLAGSGSTSSSTSSSRSSSSGSATAADSSTAGEGVEDAAAAAASGSSARAGSTSASATPAATTSLFVYTVAVSVTGPTESYLTVLERIQSLPWIDLPDATPALIAMSAQEEESESTTLTLSFKIYVHPDATFKTP
ncbi:MAG: hypothetical protein LBC35_01610 [Coriobacteriales bacterium]|jgi:hypothetical protein|nr:hypothetical protein [Coriobacteriales bacterium]